jgi:hypothetical protein
VSHPPARTDGVGETLVRLGYDESIELDVRYCDLVLGKAADPRALFDVRIKGARRSDGRQVKLYVPQDEIEGPMIHAGILEHGLRVETSRIDRTNSEEIKLAKYALRITRRQVGRGRWIYVVEALEGGPADQAVVRLQAAVGQAEEHIVPVLRGKGYAVGASDVMGIAGQLDAMRHSQQ